MHTYVYFFKEVARGWGANPGPLDFIYFLIFYHITAEPQRLPYLRIIYNSQELHQNKRVQRKGKLEFTSHFCTQCM
jgi:hypothetical protein